MNIYESISKASKQLMFQEQFWGLLLISMNKEVTNKIPTACVSKNGFNAQLSINPEYFMGLKSIHKQIGLIKHEMMHIGLFHLSFRDKFADKILFNIAADLEVNQYLDDDPTKPDKRQVDDSWVLLKNYSEFNFKEKAGTKYYYEELEKTKKEREQGISNSRTKSKVWDIYDQMVEGQWTVCSHELWKEFTEGLSEADKKLIQKQIEHQIKEVADNVKDRGYLPADLKKHIDSMYEQLPPVINWKSYLRRFGGSSNKTYQKKTRLKLNKRFSENPAIKTKTKKTILVGRDTSGSVSEKDHQEFFSELHHIWKTGVRVFIADCDADVADVFEYKGKAPDHRSGGGGTDFDPVIKYYNENFRFYNSLIYLTDGFCTAPTIKPRTMMLWVISSRGEIPPGLPGKAVQITI
jgi:predicted metal-dependent peptidase